MTEHVLRKAGYAQMSWAAGNSPSGRSPLPPSMGTNGERLNIHRLRRNAFDETRLRHLNVSEKAAAKC